MQIQNPKAVGQTYSVGGKCYCATTFDHGIGNYKVTIKGKTYTVKAACKIVGKGPGMGKNPRYNTVQCGHGPGHKDKIKGTNYRDEKQCPGRVDMGQKGCQIKGPKWDTSNFGGADGKNVDTKNKSKKKSNKKKANNKKKSKKNKKNK